MTKNKLLTLSGDFKNPFPDVEVGGEPGHEGSRVQATVSTEVHHFFKCIRPTPGTIETIVNILYAKLYNACVQRNITDLSNVREFEQFVAQCDIVPGPGSADGSTVSTANAQDDVRPAQGGSGADTQPPRQQPGNARSNARQRR